MTGAARRPPVIADVGPVAEALAAGAMVGIPTDTVYGLAVAASAPDAGARLATAKGRDAAVAVQVLVADLAQADALAGPDGLSPAALCLAERFWPGGITIVTDRRPGVSLDLGGDAGSVGLRWPDHDVVAGILRQVGPVAATSANLHGRPPLVRAADVAAAFAGTVAVVLDGGPGNLGASTVVDVRGDEPRLLREGAVSWEAVLAALS